MDRDIARVLKQMNARDLIVGITLEEVIRLLPKDAQERLADRLRVRIDEALHEGADSSDMETEGIATLQLAAFLEAAGQPPQT